MSNTGSEVDAVLSAPHEVLSPKKKQARKKRKKLEMSSSDTEGVVDRLQKQNEDLKHEVNFLKEQIEGMLAKHDNYIVQLEKAQLIIKKYESGAVAAQIHDENYEEVMSEEEVVASDRNSLAAQFPPLMTPRATNNEVPVNSFRMAANIASCSDESSKSKNENNSGNNIKIGTSKKTSLPPTIISYNVNSKDLTIKFFSLLGHKNFSFKIVNRNVTHINTIKLEDYFEVKKFLSDNKIKFYSYTPRELKPYSVVIKQLSSVYEEDEIINYLNGLNINMHINKLAKFGNDKWLIQLAKSSDIAEFKKIKFILNCKVSFEGLRPMKPPQCKNCQRYTHVASNCNMPYRCVKCNVPHGPGGCQVPPKEQNVKEYEIEDTRSGKITKRIGLPTFCINCNEEGHTAASRNCPKRIMLVKKISERKNVGLLNTNNKGSNSNTFSSTQKPVRGHLSFASILRGGEKSSPVSNRLVRGAFSNQSKSPGSMPLFDDINNEFTRLFGSGMFSCMRKVESFSQSYSLLRGDEERTMALFNLLTDLRMGNND